MIKNWLAAGTVAVTVGMTSTIAQAQTTTIPGEQVGLATGAPLPEGIYALNTFIYRRTDGPFTPDTAVNIPVLVWSTPLVPFGGRIELLVAPPTVFAFTRNPAPVRNKDISINVGTFIGGIWAFDVGNNIGISALGGVYLNELDGNRGSITTPAGLAAPVLPQLASNTYRFGLAASYTGNGFNLTGNVTFNFYDAPARFGGAPGDPTRGPFRLSDSINFDLTATKRFGNFEIGPIAYGTYNLDIGQGFVTANNRGRFAVGGLVGYDFKAFIVQAYVGRDVVTSAVYPTAFGSRANYSTDGFLRFIVPLYSPPAAAAAPVPLVRKG